MLTSTRISMVSLLSVFIIVTIPKGIMALFYIACTGFLQGLIEYTVHRYAHKMNITSTNHKIHHLNQRNKHTIAIQTTLFIYLSLLPIGLAFISLTTAIYILIWYGVYELFHEIVHNPPEDGDSYIIRRARTFHRIHHANSEKNYGVTTTGWDILFNSTNSEYNTMTLYPLTLFSFIPILAFI
jgi:sterol desaturase/sphingolipid hydroxylase (fatty acid hydroxylase superfamily)